MLYLIRRGSVEIGKFALADIKALMNAGVILPTDLFTIEGMTEAKPVSSLFSQETGLAAPEGPPPLPVFRTESGGQVVLTMAVGPSCSSCLSTDVMKASAAYELHVKQHSISAGTLSGLKFWASGKTTNQVGDNCAPPTMPELPDSAGNWKNLTNVSSMFAVMFFLLAFLGPGRGVHGGYIALGSLTAIIGFFSHRKWKARVAEIEAEHLKAMNRYRSQLADYDRTWRCNKCGVMYLA